MDQPLSFIAPRGRPALPVQPVNPDQLKQWAEETEIEDGRGAARRGGRWKVVMASGESENEVLRVYQDVRAAGYAAELDPKRVQGRLVLRRAHRAAPVESGGRHAGRGASPGGSAYSSPRVTQ